MASGRQIQKKGPSNSTPTSATGMFKLRPFAQAAEPEAATAPELQTKVEPGEMGGSRLSRIDFSAPPLIQPKLTIGAPGDKFEREADTIADTVMRMPAVSAPTPVTNATTQTPLAQAKPIAATITPVASIAQMQLEPLGSAIEEEQGEAKKGRIQRRIRVQAAGDGNLDAPSSLETQLNQTKNSGSPLSPQIRAQMEPRFGADFSGVRVHTDAPAVQMNRELGAQAFTHGNHIYYGEGKSPGNDHLTAHELTHTIQQSGSSVIQRSSNNNNVNRQSQQASQLETIRQNIRAGNLADVKARIRNSSLGDQGHKWGWEIRNNIQKDMPRTDITSDRSRGRNADQIIPTEVWRAKDFYLRVRDSICRADLTTSEGINIATTNVLDILKHLYAANDLVDRWGLSSLYTTFLHNWDNSRWALEETRKEMNWQIAQFESHYQILTNTQTDSAEIKYLATQTSINSVLLTQVASAIELAVPMNGSATFKFTLKIPLKPPFFVGLGLEVEAERQENQFKLRVEAVLEGGVKLWGLEFKASVGFYSEAQADNAYNAIKLISYGFYRKALESSVVPNKIAYAIWSGETNDEGKAKWIVDAWEAKLRGEVLDKVKDSYVDTGDLVKATVGAKNDNAGFELSYKYTNGRKHSTSSYQGQSTSRHIIEAKLKLKGIGEAVLKITREAQEREGEISFQTGKFTNVINAIIAFADSLEPSINKLKGEPKFSDVAMSLWNIRTAAKQISKSAFPPEASVLKSSQSVKFSLSFTENISTVHPKMTKASIKVMRMEKYELGLKGKEKGDGNDPAELSAEYEKASRLIEFTYNNGKWESEFF
ncbi:DUF4157 domain-containing protein [Laspinema sp. D1]|uniref:DUF4157 domain-containing protein n=1 Tax=Laspinema palackyanum D2a TaxID=2953684 RepID=A0ABT2MS94_9CYAN|nr:DUF4157 domain-containing protein [Laspinema sp. D2a]